MNPFRLYQIVFVDRILRRGVAKIIHVTPPDPLQVCTRYSVMFPDGSTASGLVSRELRLATMAEVQRYVNEYRKRHACETETDYGTGNYTSVIKPMRILYNYPATIVFWDDGTKTVVKCSPGEPYNHYTAFCAALAKKIFGSNSQVNKIVMNGTDQKTGRPIREIRKDISTVDVKKVKPTAMKQAWENAKRAAERQMMTIYRIMEMRDKQHKSIARIANELELPEDRVRQIIKRELEKRKGETNK